MNSLLPVLRSLRPKHWIKNLFVFLPVFFAGRFFSSPDIWLVGAGFVIFCLAASAGYLLNDIFDRAADVRHPIKKKRAVASGALSPGFAAGLAGIFTATAVISSFFLSGRFCLIVAIYLVLNFLYSRFLKRVVIIDVFCIGGFFLLRILAGSVLGGVFVSHWIIMMTVLLALFLGFIKRRQEIVLLPDAGQNSRQVLSQYSVGFIDLMVGVITSSVVVMYTLYTVDAATIARIGNKHLLFTVPFVYYGIFRYLYQARRMSLDGDPTNVLFSDRAQQVNIILWVAVCAGVVYLGW
jgi:4-hydroxybenzoate polyprenyltransferase